MLFMHTNVWFVLNSLFDRPCIAVLCFYWQLCYITFLMSSLLYCCDWFIAKVVYIKCCHDLRVHRAHIGFTHCSIWFIFLYNQLTQVCAAMFVAFVGLRANVWGLKRNAVSMNAPTFLSCPCKSSDMAMWCVVYMMAFSLRRYVFFQVSCFLLRCRLVGMSVL